MSIGHTAYTTPVADSNDGMIVTIGGTGVDEKATEFGTYRMPRRHGTKVTP